MATVRDLVRIAVRGAEEKKAKDVKAIDIRGLSAVTDYMIIATGSSDTNVRAIASSSPSPPPATARSPGTR